ncbi:MAG: hypothetical protein O3C63_03955 [Cyanobacteria bacterium]|nr:hypothetical protein [Cyanobacteriota bacterium]MDA1021492.1 hypothetical protein [Cyanobacteriota bacterium]
MTLLNFAEVKAAYITESRQNTILLVGLNADELADYEHKILQDKRIIEIPYSLNWHNSLENNHADEIVLKQNSGFVGLYTPGGSLVRPIDIAGGNPYLENNPVPPINTSVGHHMEWNQVGYATGGRADPYKPITSLIDPQDGSRLAAGYGYNTHIDQPKIFKKNTFIDLLNFVPIDTVTPFNYPGTFDQHGLGAVYTIGALPHIGGTIAQMRRAKSEKANFDYYQQQMPSGNSELPVVYNRYNSTDPGNPVTDDPNFIRYQQMPQAFVRDFPGYGKPVQQY